MNHAEETEIYCFIDTNECQKGFLRCSLRILTMGVVQFTVGQCQSLEVDASSNTEPVDWVENGSRKRKSTYFWSKIKVQVWTKGSRFFRSVRRFLHLGSRQNELLQDRLKEAVISLTNNLLKGLRESLLAFSSQKNLKKSKAKVLQDKKKFSREVYSENKMSNLIYDCEHFLESDKNWKFSRHLTQQWEFVPDSITWAFLMQGVGMTTLISAWRCRRQTLTEQLSA